MDRNYRSEFSDNVKRKVKYGSDSEEYKIEHNKAYELFFDIFQSLKDEYIAS